MAWKCIVHRVAAFAIIGHKRTTIPSVTVHFILKLHGKKVCSTVILEMQAAWNYQVLLCQLLL